MKQQKNSNTGHIKFPNMEANRTKVPFPIFVATRIATKSGSGRRTYIGYYVAIVDKENVIVVINNNSIELQKADSYYTKFIQKNKEIVEITRDKFIKEMDVVFKKVKALLRKKHNEIWEQPTPWCKYLEIEYSENQRLSIGPFSLSTQELPSTIRDRDIGEGYWKWRQAPTDIVWTNNLQETLDAITKSIRLK